MTEKLFRKNHHINCQCGVCKSVRGERKGIKVIHPITCKCPFCLAKRGEIIHKDGCRCGRCRMIKGEFKGKNHPLYGKPKTEKLKKEHSEFMKRKWKDEEYRKNSSDSHKKFYQTEEGKRIHSESSKKIWDNQRTKQKLIDAHIDWNFYFSHGCQRTHYPYDDTFNKELKHKIAERDIYSCQLCGELLPDKFAVHHIDYNKKNSKPENLIFLCACCHGKIHHNEKFWQPYFEQYQLKRNLDECNLNKK